MFLNSFSLAEQPFGVTPDPKFLFWSRSHREALASLYYGLENDRGFMALIAPPGMGKTTLLFQLLEKLRPSARTAFIFQTQCDSGEFLRYLMSDLDYTPEGHDLVDLHLYLNELLIEESRRGRRFVLVIDEAQNLNATVLETIRLLTDFETPSRKLLQIVLAGQQQLEEKLAQPGLAQLRQRISIVSRLSPLLRTEIDQYIAHRLRVAGYSGAPLFTPGAVSLIAEHTGGIPREINNICFNSLSLGCSNKGKTIGEPIVREVIADLALCIGTTCRSPVLPQRDRGPNLRIAASIAVMALAATLFPAASKPLRPPHSPLPAPHLAQPVKPAAPPAAPAPAAQELYQTVTVEPQDNLHQLVLRYLNRPLDLQLIRQIQRINPQVENPDLIGAGTQLRLPVNAAIPSGKESGERTMP